MSNRLILFSILMTSNLCYVRSAPEITYTCADSFNFDLFSGNNKCYHYSLSAVSWNDAKDDCLTLKGHLVKIDDENENSYIKGKVGESFWSGLNDIAVEGTYIYTDVTNTSAQFFKWAWFEPSATFLFIFGEDCIEVKKDGNWNDKGCDDKLRFVCETNSLKELKCPTGWVSNPEDVEDINACYKLTQKNPGLNFDEAVAACAEAVTNVTGSILALPTTPAESTFLASQMTTDFWVDLTDSKNESTFLKNDGTAPTFTNWYTNEPSNSWNNEHCTSVYYKGGGKGKWNDKKCSDNLGYVCKYIP